MATTYLRVLGFLFLTAACRRSLPSVDTGFAAKWPETNFALAPAERLSPPVAGRVAAYAAIALFEGWAAASVAVEAQTTVLRALYADGFPSTAVAITRLHDSLITVRRTIGVPQDVAGASRDYGARLGVAIVEWARRDGFAETRSLPFAMPVGPQSWVPTATPAQYRSQNLSGATDIILLDNPTGKAEPRTESERSLTVNRPKRPGTTPGNSLLDQQREWSGARSLHRPDRHAAGSHATLARQGIAEVGGGSR